MFLSPSLPGYEKQIYISKPYGPFVTTLWIKITGLEAAVLLLTAKLLEISGAYFINLKSEKLGRPWIHLMV